MNRIPWLSLFLFLSPFFISPTDGLNSYFSYCKKIASGNEIALDCRDQLYEDIPIEILDLPYKKM